MEKREPLNILLVSSKFPPEPSGSGLRARNTYKRLKKRFNFQYTVLCGSVDFNRPKRYVYDGVDIFRIAGKLFKRLKNREDISYESFPAKLARKLKNGINYIIETSLTWVFLLRYGKRFDLIHIFGKNFITAAVAAYAKIFNKPLIIESCNVGDKVYQYEPWLVRTLLGDGPPKGSQVVCISKRLEEIWRNTGFTGDIWCRPNPVDNKKFFIDRENKHSYRQRLGLFGKDDVVMVSIGKIRPLKNQIFLLDIMKHLPEDYKLVIAGPTIGDGSGTDEDRGYIGKIVERIKDYGLSHRVKVDSRFIDNPDEYMKASDIYLMPSKVEACATALLEALACGIPVVAHRIDGVTTDWVEDGVNGYLSLLEEKSFKDKIEMARTLTGGPKGEALKNRTSSEAVDREYIKLMERLLKRRVERYV